MESSTSRTARNRDLDNARDAIRRLGATRVRLSQEALSPPKTSSEVSGGKEATPVAGARPNPEALDPDELARAMADIERASIVLRRAEPALESWSDHQAPAAPLASSFSTWVLIGIVWTSTLLIAASVIFTIASILT